MAEPNNREIPQTSAGFGYPYYNPYFSFFAMPQFSTYPMPNMPSFGYLKLNDGRNEDADGRAEREDRNTSRIQIKSEPILLLDDEDLRIKSVQKKQQKSNSDSNIITCHCIKSHCLKEYCLCYKSGLACQDKCSCIGCKNIQDDLNEKLKPKLNKRVKCKCSKSQCVKKYCECYSAKRKCQDLCQCIGCQN